MKLTFTLDEEKMREICAEAVSQLKQQGHLLVDEDLIKKLDELEFIRNINYYTNDCSAHEQLENFIRGLSE